MLIRHIFLPCSRPFIIASSLSRLMKDEHPSIKHVFSQRCSCRGSKRRGRRWRRRRLQLGRSRWLSGGCRGPMTLQVRERRTAGGVRTASEHALTILACMQA